MRRKYDGHSADYRLDGAAHCPGDYEYRAFTPLVDLGGLCRHPLLSEETLLTEVVVEHFRELHTGIAQNVVVYVSRHRSDLISEIGEQEAKQPEFDLHTLALILNLIKVDV